VRKGEPVTGYVLALRGCTPEPLGNYLKGLGVFRLFAEQADPQARAWWKDGSLAVHTRWSKEELISFFLHGIGADRMLIYCPTPIFAPWGGRPGFYADGNERAKSRLESLRQLNPPGRFALAQQVVKITDDVLKNHGWANVSKKQRANLKSSIIAAMRNAWSESGIEWFDACLALEEDARFGFLYGTGGNEGSADITNNFWGFIEETIGFSTSGQDSSESLVASLFGSPRVGGTPTTAGQHFPLAGGSANCGQGFFGSSSANPWDVVLMMEGAVLFAGATTKRLSQLGNGKAAFPFMLDHLATDEASTSPKDEAKQDAQVIRCRAEFWMPLWSSPTSLPEIRALLSEGRLQRPSGEHTEHTLHAMEAIHSLGVSRGIETFHRVALFERRGKGYYLASSLGFHSVARSYGVFGAELAPLDEFRDQVYRGLREGPGIPERVMRARQRFHITLTALFERDEHETSQNTNEWLDVIVGTACVEREVALLKDRGRLLTPCPPLTSNGARADDGTAECHIARAIAAIMAWGELPSSARSSARSDPAVESLRANLLPLQRRGRAWAWDDTSHSAVWSRGTTLAANLTAVLRRRLIDAKRGSGDGLPFWSSYSAGYGDLLAYWNGELDEDRLTDLIHGFSLVDAGRWTESNIDARQQRDEPTPDLQSGAVWFDAEGEAHTMLSSIEWDRRPLLSKEDLRAAFELPRVYHLLKLCFTGGRLPRRPVEGRTVPRTGDEPFPPVCLDVLAPLQAGRLPYAAQLAACRLRTKGYPTALRDGDLQTLDMDIDQCRRLAAMLLIPVRQPGLCAALAIRPQAAL